MWWFYFDTGEHETPSLSNQPPASHLSLNLHYLDTVAPSAQVPTAGLAAIIRASTDQALARWCLPWEMLGWPRMRNRRPHAPDTAGPLLNFQIKAWAYQGI